jgi:hypothetical protein
MLSTESAAIDWEADIAAFLDELSGTQSELLALLVEKREKLVHFDSAGLQAIAPREEQLMGRLQGCLDRRAELLDRAGSEGRPNNNLRTLASSLTATRAYPLARQIHQASSESRILQHQSITNWVLVQRTLIHLSQMLEIIATGGRPQPTYGKGDAAHSGGSLVDQAA